jgi:transcriptional regulator with XRE-family HTH domain
MGGMDLKAWREAHGLSQAQLARILEVDQMTISRWERGSGRRGAPGRMLELALAEVERRLAEQRQPEEAVQR